MGMAHHFGIHRAHRTQTNAPLRVFRQALSEPPTLLPEAGSLLFKPPSLFPKAGKVLIEPRGVLIEA